MRNDPIDLKSNQPLSSNKVEVVCRLCGCDGCVSLGRPAYRFPPRVAGVEVKVDDLDLDLIKCPACGYYFVYPEIPADRLASCYAKSVSQWDTGDDVAELRSYKYKRELMLKYVPAGRRLLNVGCYDGGFESFLGNEYQRFGVEPSSSAAAVAAGRGIEILGETVDDIDIQKYKFDIIVLFDVAEHITEPVQVFHKLKSMLNSGGVIMFETGNMDAFPWQDLITLNPYCAIYEHVGFFNRASVERLSKIIGLNLSHFEPSVHMQIPSMLARFKRWLKIQLYWLIRRLYLGGIPMPQKLRYVACGPVPVPPVIQDHFIAVMSNDSR